MENLKMKDSELYNLIASEEKYQSETLQMIASESIQTKEALLLAGSCFNNKTSVGNGDNQRLLGSYYAGELQKLTAKRVCEIFGADYANVNTYSGSVANFTAYSAVLDVHDKVLALDPVCGAHQSHGDGRNISSKIYDFDFFGLNKDTLEIDYEEAERKIIENKPKLLVIGSAAYPRKIDYKRLSDICCKNNVLLMADIAHFSGLVAAGLSVNPVPYCDIVTASTTKTMCGPHSGFIMCKEFLKDKIEKAVYPGYVASVHLQTVAAMAFALENAKSDNFKLLMKKVLRNAELMCEALKKRGFGIFTGGTDCHMFLIDLRPFGIDGRKYAAELEKIGITVNSKAIPFDESVLPMGVRAGTTVLTQRGMGEKEMEEIADIFLELIENIDNESVKEKLKKKVKALALRFL
ncbi:MAG: serine hydroxymethyltransferase [Ruminococcaceae bacterium]|nr:serine hydroxymethyltransferase [Oscillospiraceae bacterium]